MSPESARAVTVLGIETSCDETAAAVVHRQADGRGEILSNIVLSQTEAHAAFGGVVPEIAARAHVEALDGVIRAAMSDAGKRWRDLDAVAVTAGPGLIGGLLVGLMSARAIAAAQKAAAAAAQSPGGPCADGDTDRWRPLSLPAASRLRRTHAAPRRARRRRLQAARHDDRRCARRGVRQDGKASGPALSRRAECRARGAGGQSAPLCVAASAQGRARLRFLVLRTEDGAPSGGRSDRTAYARRMSPISVRPSSLRLRSRSRIAHAAPSQCSSMRRI